jgi:HSP20 family molecular chaperone IbpA
VVDTITKRTTVVGIVTLIVGLALGLGIGVWSVKNSQASNAPGVQSSLSRPTPSATAEPLFGKNEWDPFGEIEQMQEEINRAIRNATKQFELNPGARMFRPDAGYSSSFDLRDRKDHFELRAYLPDAKASDVNVRIDNDQTLHVGVTQRKQETKSMSGGSATFTELGQYEQVVTLPEPVKSSEMKIDRHDHEIVIAIPKAKTG